MTGVYAVAVSWGVGSQGQLGIGAKGVPLLDPDGGNDLYHVWPLEEVKVKQVRGW